ncbi:MAG: hypothetical protein PHQ35_02330 [Phycisphaerae bacterium]|nr:hypothetical protein [Phycisphaerae bacterium]
MNGTYETRRHLVQKMVFFGLFIAVLLIAYFIVIWRSAIVLSEPIELNCASLSVCIPAGNGWRSEKQWKYQQNTFALDSFFNPSPGSITAIVSCRYTLAAMETTPEALFEEKVSAISGSKIVKTGRIETGNPTGSSAAKDQQNRSLPIIEWAHIEGSKASFDMFFGTVQLPNNRRLDIEVYQDMGDIGLAEDIFKSVTESLKLTDNQLLEAGSKIIAEIKSKGLDSFSAYAGKKQKDQENFFLVKDAGGRAVGFIMEAMGPNKQKQFAAWSYYYIRGRYEYKQITFFQSGNNLDEFAWKSETSGPGGRRGAEVVLDKDGIMTVSEFGLRAEESNYQIGPAAIPDVLDKFLFSQMLDSDQKEISVDIIEADGKITPVLISRIEAGPSAASPAASARANKGGGGKNRSSGVDAALEEAAYVFRMDLLDGRGFYQQVYLDDQRQISRILLQQESTYTFERTDAENILSEFPEQGHILQKKDKILEQSQLQENGEQQPAASY